MKSLRILGVLEQDATESAGIITLGDLQLVSDDRSLLDASRDVVSCDGWREVEQEDQAHLLRMRLSGLRTHDLGNPTDGMETVTLGNAVRVEIDHVGIGVGSSGDVGPRCCYTGPRDSSRSRCG